MAEILSRQATDIAARKKLHPNTAGCETTVIAVTPAAAAWANGDTFATGVRIPKGSRFTTASTVSHGAMGASVVMDLGIRNFDTKTVIDADGLAASLSVASAGRSAANSGALIAGGVDSVTTEDVEVYATLSGATPTANAQFRLEIRYISLGC
jgi:hypothetical protein